MVNKIIIAGALLGTTLLLNRETKRDPFYRAATIIKMQDWMKKSGGNATRVLDDVKNGNFHSLIAVIKHNSYKSRKDFAKLFRNFSTDEVKLTLEAYIILYPGEENSEYSQMMEVQKKMEEASSTLWGIQKIFGVDFLNPGTQEDFANFLQTVYNDIADLEKKVEQLENTGKETADYGKKLAHNAEKSGEEIAKAINPVCWFGGCRDKRDSCSSNDYVQISTTKDETVLIKAIKDTSPFTVEQLEGGSWFKKYLIEKHGDKGNKLWQMYALCRQYDSVDEDGRKLLGRFLSKSGLFSKQTKETLTALSKLSGTNDAFTAPLDELEKSLSNMAADGFDFSDPCETTKNVQNIITNFETMVSLWGIFIAQSWGYENNIPLNRLKSWEYGMDDYDKYKIDYTTYTHYFNVLSVIQN